MTRVLVTRLLGALAAMLGASIVSFVLLRALPSAPARLIAGPLANEETVTEVAARLGLDRPLLEQYVIYVRDFVRGEWGHSYSAGAPVSTLFGQRLGASVELALAAFLIAASAAVGLGALATFRRGLADGLVRVVANAAMGTPPFWFGLLALLLFFELLGWAPGPGGRLGSSPAPPAATGLYTVDALLAGQWATFVDAARHLALPAIALAIAPFGYLVRLLRANVLDAARAPHVTVAVSKGITRWRAHTRHVLPNASLPTLTASGMVLAQLLGGSVLIEKVFNWPGLGSLVVSAILRQDYAVVQAFVLFSAAVYTSVSLLVDLAYGALDPRQRAA